MSHSNQWHAGAGLRHPSTSAQSYNSNYGDFGHSNTWATTDAPDRETGTLKDKYEKLKGYFGEVRHEKKPMISDYYEKENFDYPEAFNMLYGRGNGEEFDRNGHMERVMIEKTMASKNMYLTRMAPWKQHENSLTFDWSKTLFTETMLDRLPEESVPRLMTSRRTSGRTSMIRYGIALLLEATFAETPAGKQTYIMNLEQMRVACVQTASYGVMISIMEHQPYVDPFRRGKDASRTEKDFEAIDKELNEEIDQWGLLHKHQHGMAIVLARMRDTLANRGKQANFTMTPQGSSTMLNYADLHTNKFFVSGHATPQEVDRSFAEHVTCESHMFSMGDDQEGHDPIFRHRTIGAFATLDDLAVRDEPIEEYRTKQMDSVMYDQSLDEFFMARYAHGYKYTGVWDYMTQGAPITREIGRGAMLAYGCYTYGQLYRKCTNGTQRAVDKIHMLPESKRQAFINSVRLLAADSELVDLDGRDFPEERSFDARKFQRLEDGDEPLDTPVLISVNQHRAYAQSQGSFTHMDIMRQGEHEAKMAANQRKRKLYGEEEAEQEEKTNRQLYEENEDMEIDDDQAPIAEEYHRLADGNVVKIPGTDGIRVRKVRRKFRATTNVGDAVQNGASIAVLIKSIESLVDKEHDDIKKFVGQYTAAIRALHATDNQKAVLLTELARVVKGVLYTIKFADRDAIINDVIIKGTDQKEAEEIFEEAPDQVDPTDFSVKFVAGFAVFASRVDVRVCIDTVATHRSLLEEACKDSNVNLNSAFADSIVKPYWWRVDGASEEDREDGQVGLTVFGRSRYVSLPHDSFAATLAANHSVLFDLDHTVAEDAVQHGFKPAISTSGCKQSRVDALHWSIALSMIHANTLSVEELIARSNVEDADDALNNATETDPTNVANEKQAVLDAKAAVQRAVDARNPIASVAAILSRWTAEQRIRLVRMAKNKTRKARVLLSQLHLASRILSIDNAMVQYLTDGNVVPVEPLSIVASPDVDIPSSYASPVVLNSNIVNSIKKKKSNTAFEPLLNASSSPASAEEPQAWTKAFISDCIDRATVTNGLLYAFCVENDIPVPFCLKTWRPNKCFNMGSALSMVAGSNGAARTYYQNPHMMMAGDAAKKMIYGHFTLYFKTIVFSPEAIVIKRDIYCNDYLGGNGRKSWNPLSVAHTAAYASGEMGTASIFWTFAPMNAAEGHWWQSITGEMPESMPCTQDVRNAMLWEGCEAFSDFWGYKTNGRTSYAMDGAYSSVNNPNDRKHNVLCLQDFQQKYDPATKLYSRTQLNRGHWGEAACYPGAAKVMRGAATHFDIPSYMPIRKTAMV